ncbi:unnamed protein product [Allacma fusca]|uniref:G-protein coupled receptors family 1 profile domain-containing protein n=1 Tax=Allacma fusca TaxID=39272 RepID=A0A8J2NYN2_9HEXA|nr:unnamed protein product [Allacma fusca]
MRLILFLLPQYSLQALQLGLVPFEVANDGTKVPVCMVKKTLIEHSFEIATFVFFVAPMILITALYILIGLTLRNASHVKESKLRLRKSLSSHKREVGQQRVLKMLDHTLLEIHTNYVCVAHPPPRRLTSFN